MEITDFFDLDEGPPRDRWGRPLLIPRGGTEADRRWYTRASSLADMIEDFSHLQTWEKRYLAVGLSRRMDLVRLAAAEPYTTGFDKGDEKENRASGRRLDEIIRRVLDAAKIHEKADYGTAVHSRTEPGNDGTDPDDFQADEVKSFWDLLEKARIAIIGTEVFTANDRIWTAGTFDHMAYVPGYGICVTDKKTSREPKESYDVQLAIYANGDVYDYSNDTRMTLEEYVASLGWDPRLLRRDVGFLFWIKNGKTTIHELDLRRGWNSAIVAADHVRDDHRKKKKTAPNVTGKVESADLMTMIQGAPTADFLHALWDAQGGLWTPEHVAAATARREAL